MTVWLSCFLALLSGCEGRPHNSAKENPPPKPPNCPDLPELGNLKLNGGEIADVRIIQSGGLKLYIPAAWFRGKFSDSIRYKGLVPETSLGIYNPDIHEVECPGVVHEYIYRGQIFSYITPKIDRIRAISPLNISLDSKIDYISIGRFSNSDFQEKSTTSANLIEDHIMDWPTADSPSAVIIIEPNNVQAVYRWPKGEALGSEDWKIYRDSVASFVAWLRTAPKDRDNDRLFKLGVHQQ